MYFLFERRTFNLCALSYSSFRKGLPLTSKSDTFILISSSSLILPSLSCESQNIFRDTHFNFRKKGSSVSVPFYADLSASFSLHLPIDTLAFTKLLFLEILSVIINRRYLTWKSCICQHFFLYQYIVCTFVKFLHLPWPLVSFYLLISFSFNELNMHCNENLVYVFPEKELRGLNSNFHIHVLLSIFSCSRLSA